MKYEKSDKAAKEFVKKYSGGNEQFVEDLVNLMEVEREDFAASIESKITEGCRITGQAVLTIFSAIVVIIFILALLSNY